MPKPFALASLLALTACNGQSSQEDAKADQESVILLLCEGEEVTTEEDGSISSRERMNEIYRLDEAAHTIQTWRDASQSFADTKEEVLFTPTVIRHVDPDQPALAGATASKSITFDRIAGRVTDRLMFTYFGSNQPFGGSVIFDAPCKTIDDPAAATKF